MTGKSWMAGRMAGLGRGDAFGGKSRLRVVLLPNVGPTVTRFVLCSIIHLFFEIGTTILPMYSELDEVIGVATNSEHGVDTLGYGDSVYGKLCVKMHGIRAEAEVEP